MRRLRGKGAVGFTYWADSHLGGPGRKGRGIGMSEVNQNTEREEAADRLAQTAGEGRQEKQVQDIKQAPDTRHTRLMQKNFGFFGPAAFLYAAVYAFCMYKNSSGISFSFFMAGSLLYLCLCLSKLEISLKKGSVWYMTGIMLLGVSTFCTDDVRIINLNKMGIFLLMMSLLLKQFYDTSDWGFGKYFHSIFTLVFASLGEIGSPFRDMAAYFRENKDRKNKKLWAAATGLLIAVPLLLVIASLLASADAVFRGLTRRFYEWVQPGSVFNILLRMAFIFFASYLLLAFLCRHTIREEVKDSRKGEPVLAITITGLLSLMYLLFSGIQIWGLFLQKMALPEGYTYAEYAREGFFQLLAVSVLNLLIVLFTLNFFRQNKLLKAILTVMSLCTYVMIASSAVRMILYIKTYDLTFLRILVLWALTTLSVLFAGVIVSVFKEKFPLFRYGTAAVTVLYLALSFSHPDYIIARVNLREALQSRQEVLEKGSLDREEEGYVDYAYLSGLSADAAPVLLPYLERLGYDLSLHEEDIAGMIYGDGRSCGRHHPAGFGWYYLEDMKERLETMSPRTYNISRHMALKLLEK